MSEVRLIDANALMETIRAHDYLLRAHFNSTDNGMFTIGIQQAVDEQPTVDAVPWEFLERYADWFCASVSFPEFIREAKAFYRSTAAMD